MAGFGEYTIFAAVYHIPPPVSKIKLERMAIFDKKGRLVESMSGGTLDEYEGRFSRKMARQVIAGDYQFFGYPVTEEDVQLVPVDEVERIERGARMGGFQIYVYAERVRAEQTLYLKGIYRLDMGERAFPETRMMDFIHTEGNETHEALQALVSNYIKQRFGYDVEPGEIHFMGKRLRRRFEKLTEDYDLRP
jgi:hypothetical protein